MSRKVYSTDRRCMQERYVREHPHRNSYLERNNAHSAATLYWRRGCVFFIKKGKQSSRINTCRSEHEETACRGHFDEPNKAYSKRIKYSLPSAQFAVLCKKWKHNAPHFRDC